ncbi:hypothetical protein LAZ67_13000728 [Cordylochernes scorpioides]|uniref:Reverse transcriptase Ty1/copia-type domain-containing protein n=1 Tax=Cordylochernes scorpioides TaxID=51811 RepID=A0ABY6L539_9ARAC|nr:hypothetical protein LAZ67_13000728 [Cordylochernes scorpioides]
MTHLIQVTKLVILFLKTSHQGYSIPNCQKEAMNLPDYENWIGAMKKELDSQREHKFGHFNLFPKALNKWIYTIKKDATTQDRKYKARLVATGYQQSYGQDYEYIFSPVIKNDSLRVILAFSAIMQYDIKCFDIVTAYLYGNLEETIYMKQPEGFENSRTFFYRERDAKDTNDVEIWAQIGLLLLSGTNKACHLSFQEIWADDGTGFKIFRSVMNRERFLFLLRIRYKLQNYVSHPGEYLTVDEKIIPFEGRCSFKQYFPNKPAKYGIETVVFST